MSHIHITNTHAFTGILHLANTIILLHKCPLLPEENRTTISQKHQYLKAGLIE